MRKYSIFYIEGGKYYQVYQSGGVFYLGGSKCEWLLFSTKAEAKRVAKRVIKQKSPFFDKGQIVIKLVRLKPIN
jgi:hypothetical protein